MKTLARSSSAFLLSSSRPLVSMSIATSFLWLRKFWSASFSEEPSTFCCTARRYLVAQPQIFSSFVLLAFPLSLDGHVTFLVPNYNEAKYVDTVSTYLLIDIITVPFLKISDIFVILLHKFDI